MYTEIYGSSDRIGGNIADLISQILYSIHNKIYIRYNRNRIRVVNSFNQGYNNSIFFQTLFDIIDKHNENVEDGGNSIDLFAPSHFEVLSKTTLSINQDQFSYFKEKVYLDEMKKRFMQRAKEKGYEVPFDSQKTILIHLRLEDVSNKPDYDWMKTANDFRNQIENGLIPDNKFNQDVFKKYHSEIKDRFHVEGQSSISPNKIKKCLDNVLKYKPEYEVVVVTNPGENLSFLPFKFKYISNQDECYDLFMLCSSETVIFSRSNFALSSLFFGIQKDVYLPLWNHVPCYGLYSKYDKTNFKYFG